MLRVIDTGPITNHVNFVNTPRGQFAYVTIGGLNQVKAFRTDRFRAGRDHSGRRPAAWHLAFRRRDARLCRDRERRCGDRHRHVDQPGDCDDPERTGGTGAGLSCPRPCRQRPPEPRACSRLVSPAPRCIWRWLRPAAPIPTTVSLFDQGLTQVLQAAVAGLEPAKPYMLALTAECGWNRTDRADR